MSVGIADRGPVGTPQQAIDLPHWSAIFGGRSGASATASDAVETMFGEGLSSVGAPTQFFSRVVGPGVVNGSLTDKDQNNASTVVITAKFPVNDNSILRRWETGTTAGTVKLSIFDSTVSATAPVRVYDNLSSVPTLVQYVNSVDTYVTLTDAASSSPLAQRLPVPTQTVALAGGTDDRANAGDAQWGAALNTFTTDFGAGMLLAPGRGTAATHALLNTAAVATRRFWVGDGPDLPATGDLLGLAAADSILPGQFVPGDSGMVVGPYVLIPSAPGGSQPRVVSGAAFAVGRCGYNDAQSGLAGGADNAIRSSLGYYGDARFATGVHGTFAENQRDLLDGGPGAPGASVIRSVRSHPCQLMGFRTASTDMLSYDAAGVREALWCAQSAAGIADGYVGRTIDGQGHVFSDLKADTGRFLLGQWNANALFGATRAAAFTTDTGPTVNTTTTIRAGQINIRGSYVTSATGFRVNFTETRQGIPSS